MTQRIEASLNSVGQQVVEAVGGVWTAMNDQPAFVPLDQFVTERKLAGDPIGDLNYEDLALEFADAE